MITLPLALLAAAAQPTASAQGRFLSCADDVKSNPQQALSAAQAWIDKGGSASARQCLAMAYAALDRWTEAAGAFEQAAVEAERGGDSRRAELRSAAGSAWLGAGDSAKAKADLDIALSSAGLSPAAEADARLDRAQAEVALNDLPGARTDIDKALELAPQGGFGYYLSAALAVKERNLTRAHLDIARAVTLSPNDGSFLLEAGNIAGMSGELDAAKRLYERAAKAEPDSEAGRAAAAALAANGGMEGPAPASAPPAQPH